jgi:hypothetical protein
MDPAISVTYEGDKLFLVDGGKKVELQVPYDAEVTCAHLHKNGFSAERAATAVRFLDALRDNFQRPDILAVA